MASWCPAAAVAGPRPFRGPSVPSGGRTPCGAWTSRVTSPSGPLVATPAHRDGRAQPLPRGLRRPPSSRRHAGPAGLRADLRGVRPARHHSDRQWTALRHAERRRPVATSECTAPSSRRRPRRRAPALRPSNAPSIASGTSTTSCALTRRWDKRSPRLSISAPGGLYRFRAGVATSPTPRSSKRREATSTASYAGATSPSSSARRSAMSSSVSSRRGPTAGPFTSARSASVGSIGNLDRASVFGS